MSLRQQRVAESLRVALSEVLRECRGLNPELLRYAITVNAVTVSPDLHHATAHVSSLMAAAGNQDAEAMHTKLIEQLQEEAGVIRTQVAHILNMRYAIQIKFQVSSF